MSSTPHFLIIGAMKAGTTTFYDGLKQSQDTFLPQFKEPSILTRYQSADSCKQAYQSHFAGNEGQLLGEATTHYTMTPLFDPVAQKAKLVCGSNLKIIMILRNPFDRIISHLRHDYRVGRIKVADFDEAIFADPRYVDTSNYAMQLKPWIAAFGMQQIHLVRFENFRSQLHSELTKAADFLNISFTDPEKFSNVESNTHEVLGRHRFFFLRQYAPVYFSSIGKHMPRSVIKLYRKLMMSDRKPVEVKLGENTRCQTIEKLTGFSDELQSLTGFDVSSWMQAWQTLLLKQAIQE